MKACFELKKLEDACTVASSAVSQNQLKDEKGDFPIYGASGLIKNISFYHRNRPYISIVKDGSGYGRVTKMDAYTSVIGTLQYILPKDNIDLNYLFYSLLSIDFDKYVAGAAIPHIYFKDYKHEPFQWAPLSEQKRISSILDEAFDNISAAQANAEHNIRKTHELFISHLDSIFNSPKNDWDYKCISDISKHSLGKMLDKKKNKGDMKPYLRNINVRWFHFDLSDLFNMPFLSAESDKYSAIKGDVLICEGGYPGRAAIWNEDYPIYFQKALHRVRFNQSELNKWFVYYLFFLDSTDKLKQYFSGAGIQHFTGEALARFILPVPPLSELKQYIERFDSLSKEIQSLESIYKHKIIALDELKKSLLNKAFSGEL